MEADVRWCTSCKLKGKTKRLKLFQINDELATLLCDNEECMNLGEISSVSSRIVPRKSSDIPIRKKRRPNPIPVSTPKMPNVISQPSPPGSRSSASPHGKSTESHRLLKIVPSLEAMPRVRLWRNKSALCWLDACMFVLVSCRSLRVCLVRLPEKSLVRTLCNAFEGGQHTQCSSQSNASCSKADANSIEKPEESNTLGDSGSPASSQSNQLTIPSSAPDSNDSLELCNAKPMQNDQDPTQVVTAVGRADHGSVDPLDEVRDKLFQRLQTKLRCRLGQEESPVFALPALLRLDETVEEHFLCRYRWEFYCDACGHTDISVNKKTVLTLPSVPADFNMANPTMLQHCPQCQSQDQKSHLVFHSFPACVMLHFQDGLSDGDFMKHSRFMQGGETYTLSAVIRYRQKPNHFITLLRDPESNHWLEYDDILPSPFTWQQRTPRIPAKEIHLLIWERVDTPCTACIRMYSDITALRESLAHRTLSSIPERKLNMNTQPSRDSLRNRKIVTREREGSLQSVLQSGAEHHANDGHINNAQCSKEGTVGGLERCIDHPKAQEAVIDLTSSDTNTATADGGVAVSKGSTPYSSPFLNAHLEANTERSRCLPEGPLLALNRLLRFRPSITKKDIEGRKQIEPVIASNISANIKQKAQRRPQSFLEKVTARRKGKHDERDASTQNKPNTLSVLGKIPQQLLKFSGAGTRTKVVNTENVAQQNCASSRTASVLSQIPKQLLPSAMNGKLLVTHSKQSLHGTRVKNVDSIRRGSMKTGKFQPYSHGVALPEPLGGVNQDVAPHQQTVKTVGLLKSWQKRVGMFSVSASTTSKRVRRDSTDENSFSNQPKQTWCPSSSVSSPSACSDVSSLSDNQSFASGRDDLATCTTIEELCKALGSDYSCTPSVRSRFSSPSQDMFFSETLSDGGASFMLDDIFNEDHCLLNSDSEHTNSKHHISEQPSVGHTSDAHTSNSSMHFLCGPSSADSQPSSLTLHNSTQDITNSKHHISEQPSVGHASDAHTSNSMHFLCGPSSADSQPSSLTHNSTQDITISGLNHPMETPHVPIMEGTLPCVARTCSANEPSEPPTKPLMNHFARLPSCVASPPVVSTVAMQPDLPGPNNSTCDSVIPSHAPSTFNLLSDTTTGAITSTSLPVSNEAISEGHNDFDDILMDSKLFEENFDLMETEWSSSNLVELLA